MTLTKQFLKWSSPTRTVLRQKARSQNCSSTKREPFAFPQWRHDQHNLTEHFVVRPIGRPLRVGNIDDPLQILAKLHVEAIVSQSLFLWEWLKHFIESRVLYLSPVMIFCSSVWLFWWVTGFRTKQNRGGASQFSTPTRRVSSTQCCRIFGRRCLRW